MAATHSPALALSDGQHFTAELTAKPRSDNSFNTAAHGLRGIASLMVFFAHLLGGTAEHIYQSNSAYVTGIAPYWNFGTFGVCLFFVISGFVILPSAIRYSPAQFAARRFLRLYPLFFALSLLFIVLNATTNFYPKTNNLISVLAGLTFLNLLFRTEQLTPNAWSLTFEVWFYVFTAAFVFFAIRRPNKLGIVILSLLSILFIVRYPIAMYFLAGGLIRLAHDRSEWISRGRHRIAEGAALAACVFLSTRGHYNYHLSDFQNKDVPLLVAATALYFCLAVSRNSLTALVLGNRVLRYFGTVSYSLYLVHPYTYYLTRAAFRHAHLFTGNILLSMSAFIAVTCALTSTLR